MKEHTNSENERKAAKHDQSLQQTKHTTSSLGAVFIKLRNCTAPIFGPSVLYIVAKKHHWFDWIQMWCSRLLHTSKAHLTLLLQASTNKAPFPSLRRRLVQEAAGHAAICVKVGVPPQAIALPAKAPAIISVLFGGTSGYKLFKDVFRMWSLHLLNNSGQFHSKSRWKKVTPTFSEFNFPPAKLSLSVITDRTTLK